VRHLDVIRGTLPYRGPSKIRQEIQPTQTSTLPHFRDPLTMWIVSQLPVVIPANKSLHSLLPRVLQKTPPRQEQMQNKNFWEATSITILVRSKKILSQNYGKGHPFKTLNSWSHENESSLTCSFTASVTLHPDRPPGNK